MQQFGVRNFFIWAETFVVDKRYVEELCREIIHSNLKISWTCNSRVDTVDAELLKLMAQAGCWMISFGIESAEQKVLDGVDKGTTVEQACCLPCAWHVRRASGPSAILFSAFPARPPSHIERTIAYAKDLGLDLAQFYCAVPFPGSRLYEKALQEGWLKDPDFSHFNQDSAIMELPTISIAEVNKYRARAYRSFYFNIRNSYRLLKLMSVKDMGKTLRAGLDFLGWTKSEKCGMRNANCGIERNVEFGNPDC